VATIEALGTSQGVALTAAQSRNLLNKAWCRAVGTMSREGGAKASHSLAFRRSPARWCWLFLLLCSCGGNINRLTLNDGRTVLSLVSSRDTSVVLLYDPARCLTCDATMPMWLEWGHKNPGRFAFILTRRPMDAEQKELTLLHIPYNGILGRSPINFFNKPRSLASAYLIVGGRLVATDLRADRSTKSAVERFAGVGY
jgi:hypothetical protein